MNAWLWGSMGFGGAELLALFTHFMLLSLLAVGGAIATVPEMHRFVVVRQGWLDDAQFTNCVALAQAAPGPNVLFVAVIGLQVGGLAGVVAAMAGTLLPSTTLALMASRWGEQRREARAVRAFTAGMAPLTLGLLLSTGWILLEPTRSHWIAVPLLVAATLWLMLRTRLSPLWMLGAGAVAGAAGWV
ncbi:Chromate transporter [Rubrivivax sp. A210]|uniref:chromate transporter n=1 Tax=Rubrivivax sp. A210 TaxID=2772301 RepID=UPI0019B9D84F|nr:chromate transporter [Rubrivivax sp. A210]CAD5374899.1 Chromate transporter [Rubrivivax sp. A210]